MGEKILGFYLYKGTEAPAPNSTGDTETSKGKNQETDISQTREHLGADNQRTKQLFTVRHESRGKGEVKTETL